MNWGKAIPLVFILFAGFIGTMVFRMSSQRIDLVREDYYQDELTYQQHIDRVSNAHHTRQGHTNSSIAMMYQSDQQQVVFVLPDTFKKGKITFYRPADRRADFQVPIVPTHSVRQVVPTKTLAKGYWRVQFTWSDGRQDYYTEEQLFI
ncbi:FixH family protein [Spirosoma radiotolerans]|uniref:FixH n=1 Tax=Spirosoma radiotolerans TaxID=1379870 RepID=A0A0E3ZY24_9BACT|nr:FixH family protein [Spirosoma radiotolerans]AKD57448.1 FixH [Spirosoma radiotolerans]